jgi:hypothetical protein
MPTTSCWKTPDIQAQVRSDPRAFLEELLRPVIFDAIQNVPDCSTTSAH